MYSVFFVSTFLVARSLKNENDRMNDMFYILHRDYKDNRKLFFVADIATKMSMALFLVMTSGTSQLTFMIIAQGVFLLSILILRPHHDSSSLKLRCSIVLVKMTTIGCLFAYTSTTGSLLTDSVVGIVIIALQILTLLLLVCFQVRRAFVRRKQLRKRKRELPLLLVA